MVSKIFTNNTKEKNKKGQVTIFVIIALVLLIIVVLFLYMGQKKSPQSISLPQRTAVSSDFKPIQEYIELCMGQLGTEAIYKLGQHGGYIDPTDKLMSNKAFDLKPNTQYDSDFAFLDSQDINSSVAFWYYTYPTRLCKNCAIWSQLPTIFDMERQINYYISKKIPVCLDNFTEYKKTGYIVNSPDIFYIKTTISNESEKDEIIIQGNYSINVSYKGTTVKIDKYYASLNIPLFKAYITAYNLTETEYYSNFLENLNIYLIGYYSGLDYNMLPPTYAYDTGYNIYFWFMTSVKDKMRMLLNSYIPLMQIPGTKNYVAHRTINESILENTFNKYLDIPLLNVSGLSDKTYNETEINFMYTNQDIYLKISPSKGELISPKVSEGGTLTALISEDSSKAYHFFYDISYPVIVEVRQHYSDNKNYIFMFALESNIIENQNIKTWINGSQRPIYWDTNAIQVDVNNPNTGSELQSPFDSNKKYAYKSRPQQSLMCEENQKISGDIKIKTADKVTGLPLSNVKISYGCGSYFSCNFGETKYTNTGDYALFTSKMPICTNGYIQFDKQGYETKKIGISTEIGVSNNIGTIKIDPIFTKKVVIKVLDVQKIVNPLTHTSILRIFNTTARDLKETESVLLKLDKISTDTLEMPWAQTVFLGKNGTGNKSSMLLVQGKYTLSASLLDSNGIFIPKNCERTCVDPGLFGCDEWKEYPSDNIIIPVANLGGITIDEMHAITISKNMLLSNQTLVFFVLKIPRPGCINDMDDISKTDELSLRYMLYLMPKMIDE